MAALDQLMAAEMPWLADGGLESDLARRDRLNLPQDSAFVLLFEPRGRASLTRHFDRYLDLAQSRGRGFVLDTATWRANPGWAGKLGLNDADIRHANQLAVRLAQDIRAARPWAARILINGCIGPLDDGRTEAPADLARHAVQLQALAAEKVDLVTALSLGDVEEAIVLTKLARGLGLPIVISFLLEHEGRLPTGVPLAEAVARVDAATADGPVFYGISGTHPSRFLDQLRGPWLSRIGLLRPNATAQSLAEIRLSGQIEANEPTEYGVLFAELARRLPALRIVGGGVGAQETHIAAAADWA